MSLLGRAQAIFLDLAVRAEAAAGARKVRRFFVEAGRGLRTVADARKAIQGIADAMQRHQDEVDAWVGPDALSRGEGGAFDACDLRHWLALAERAGVPTVPAREIASFSEDEYSAISGEQAIPDVTATRRLRSVLGRAAAEIVAEDPTLSDDVDGPRERTERTDVEALYDRLADAMDDVPEGWMVRSQRCGGSELKSLAGFGIMDDSAPEVRFGPGLEVGPGWVRVGNRRRINHADPRTLEMIAQGPGGAHFLARPWISSSRYLVSEDPHRHGTPFAGKGVWPAEWRAIVDGGVVRSVASYYGWADAATPETARTALKVRELAQRIVDEAMAQEAFPRFYDIERIREHPDITTREGLADAMATRWGRETVACTLDFIETGDGPLLLEGGPSVSPFGGGHPCAAAGSLSAIGGSLQDFEGVAFRVPEGVLVADPSTWDGEHADVAEVHLDWKAVGTLAASDAENAS